MRIWALSKRNKIAVFCMGGLILLNSVLWEGNCFQMVGFRVLPRVCALRQAQPLGLDILAKIFIPIQMAFFVGLHLYYLCGVVLKDPAPTASQSHTQSQVAMGPMRKPSLTPTVRTLSPAAGRFKATLRMFMNDIVVMLIDVIRPPLTYVSAMRTRVLFTHCPKQNTPGLPRPGLPVYRCLWHPNCPRYGVCRIYAPVHPRDSSVKRRGCVTQHNSKRERTWISKGT
ncbi:hypothetical protein M427DRAFT_282188 [Gonapodya prolifera JEL478]|uniref:Uncharacterized protein n=1 Tax=Gonapodya prolifera (strain JEL478) TaxID=1344416 RepID=A0A139AYY0_GONPJ|nr:hypothetical protein M427DRAFT_282188 [Gonapodya prolifera JEL478]|eukprot:KXS21929.1 hypothetical protein M427DRAFT_282188 [Gonapodya prolifera JEL478]